MFATLLIAPYAFGVSLLTLFTGFGLGTLLLPAFAVFFPVELAIAMTAVVHAANNLFKVALLARHARRDVALRFGVPAVAASFVGALILTALARGEALHTWEFMGRPAEITPVKLVAGALVLGFSLFELVPKLREWRAPVRFLPLGGALSGFFGGLSGHQGALRAAFLTPLGLTPKEFAATQAVIALLVDGARLVVYGAGFVLLRGGAAAGEIPWAPVVVASLAAFAGAWLGKRWLEKVTITGLRRLVGALLLVVGTALVLGVA